MKAKVALTLFLCVLALLPSYSETQSTPSSRKTVLLWRRTNPNRPTMPSSENIECYYGNGFIGVEFPDNISGVSISIGDSASTIWSGYLTPESPYAHTPMLMGPYTITITTDSNVVYSGNAHF